MISLSKVIRVVKIWDIPDQKSPSPIGLRNGKPISLFDPYHRTVQIIQNLIFTD